MKKRKIIRNPNEKRKDYLFRVAIEYMEAIHEDDIEIDIIYDEAVCGGNCLVEDMKMEIEEDY